MAVIIHKFHGRLGWTALCHIRILAFSGFSSLSSTQSDRRAIAAIILGWAIGYRTEIHQAAIALLFSFLAGGVVLNILKEELPEERQSKFWAFALGAAIYAALLVAV